MTLYVEAGVEDHFAAGDFSDGLDERVEFGIVFFVDGLNAGGAVDVGDRGEGGAMLGANVGGHDHVGKLETARDFEPVLNLLEADGGREWAEGFAHFDHRVDAVAHFGVAGIGEDAAMAEGARAELHAAAVPAEDAARFDELGGFGAGFGERCEARDFDAAAGVG